MGAKTSIFVHRRDKAEVRSVYEELNGTTFGELLVIEPDSNPHFAKCQCSCGGSKITRYACLLAGSVKSCGCLFTGARRMKKGKHGMYGSPEHRAWMSIRQRCLNPKDINYKHYGGRGIMLHPAWLTDFKAFFLGVGTRPTSRHSIDRIDVDGNYEPGNVRWTTQEVQCNNKRNNVFITYRGETLTIAQWGRRQGIRGRLIGYRINNMGWSVERAITELPKQQKNSSEELCPCCGGSGLKWSKAEKVV